MQKLQLDYKEIEKYDVVIVGGGVAGVSAAVSSARNKAKTLLLEKNTFLGGMATGGLVTPMMNNALNPKELLTDGIFLEICNRLKEAKGGNTFSDGNPGWFNPEIYKIVLDEICVESGVKVFFESTIVNVSMKNNTISNLYFLKNGSCFSVSGKQFIDSTGEGELIKLACVGFNEEDKDSKQATSLRFMLSNVDLKTFANYLKENDKSGDSPTHELEGGEVLLSTAYTPEKDWTLKPLFEKAINSGDLTKEEASYFQLFSIPYAKGFVAFNCPRLWGNDYIKARQMIKNISNFCIKYLPGFQDSYISQIAPLLGVREKRRLKGRHTLTAKEVLEGKKFEDGVAKSNWSIDIHSERPLNGKTPPEGDYYEIPLRSLLPKEDECKNLIVCGKPLSASFEAQGSARIQPNCIAMGEAAGKLAAERIAS